MMKFIIRLVGILMVICGLLIVLADLVGYFLGSKQIILKAIYEMACGQRASLPWLQAINFWLMPVWFGLLCLIIPIRSGRERAAKLFGR